MEYARGISSFSQGRTAGERLRARCQFGLPVALRACKSFLLVADEPKILQLARTSSRRSRLRAAILPQLFRLIRNLRIFLLQTPAFRHTRDHVVWCS